MKQRKIKLFKKKQQIEQFCRAENKLSNDKNVVKHKKT